MIKHPFLSHRFVRSIPKELEPGVLYLSMEYGTAIHSCCCGCGNQVVTPFSPTGWQMSFDGESVSLSPSIGNWSFPCRSHYIVNKGHIIEAGQWSQTQVGAGRKQDRINKEHFYQSGPKTREKAGPSKTARKGVLAKLVHWLFGG